MMNFLYHLRQACPYTFIFLGVNAPVMGQAILPETRDLISHELHHIEHENIGVRVQSPTQIVLEFNLAFDPAKASQSAKYSINNRSPKGVTLDDNGYGIILDLSTPLEVDASFSLSVTTDFLIGSKSKTPFVYQGKFEDGIYEIVNTEESTLLLIHNFKLDSSSFSAADFMLVDQGHIATTALAMKDNILELKFPQALQPDQEYLLQIPARKANNGSVYPATRRSIFFHSSPNELVDAVLQTQNALKLTFSHPLDPVSALIPELYTLDGRHPNYVELGPDSHTVLLHGLKSHVSSKEGTFEIEIRDLRDSNGNNTTITKSLNFKHSRESIKFGSVVINEVMAAPRANNSLPNVEYIELFNTTDQPIDLTGFLLHNTRRNTVLPEFILAAKAYVILSPRNQAPQFHPYGETLGLTSWPTLLNAGDRVLLTDPEGIPMDSLRYTSASYGGSGISQGGYSLELVNPFTTCRNSSNIKPSESPNRGTPGTVNSVFDPSPDRIAPKFVRSEVLQASQAVLYFSKLLQAPNNQLKIEITPSKNIVQVDLDETNIGIRLTFETEILQGIKYDVNISNLRDCAGNLYTSQDAYIVLPAKAEEGDVVLSEVLFNPRTSAPKFVEIYNTSSKHISLKDWKLANLDSDGEIANRRLLYTEEKILEPHAFMVFTTNAERLLQEYPKGKLERFEEYSSLPSYPISSGNVVFLNPDESLIEIFSYADRMHHGLLRDTKGVSLERLSYDVAVDKPANWQSASTSEGYATPGYRNSQNFDGNNDFGIEISPKVFVPDGPGELNFTKIGYKMEQPGQVGTIHIYSVDGQLVRQLCQNAIWGVEGFYTWDGTFSNGNKVRPGYYLVWVELFDIDGNVRQIKKTVVVGTKF